MWAPIEAVWSFMPFFVKWELEASASTEKPLEAEGIVNHHGKSSVTLHLSSNEQVCRAMQLTQQCNIGWGISDGVTVCQLIVPYNRVPVLACVTLHELISVRSRLPVSMFTQCIFFFQRR